MRANNFQQGLTLIELVVFIVIVSVGLIGILSVVDLTTRRSADPMVRKQMISIAEAMMEEVFLKGYRTSPDECTEGTTPSCRPNALADRGNYNDVEDYNGFDMLGIVSLDESNNISPVIVAGLEGYRVQVAVVPPTTPINGVVARAITVTVTAPGQQSFALTGYRTNYGN